MYRKTIIFASIDTFHPISGVKNKLMAYIEFLRKYPGYRGRIMFIQYVTPILCCGGTTIDKYSEEIISEISTLKEFRDDIRVLVTQIQKEFGPTSIVYQEDNPCLEKRLALWTLSHFLLVSSLKEGVCLVSFHFLIFYSNPWSMSPARSTVTSLMSLWWWSQSSVVAIGHSQVFWNTTPSTRVSAWRAWTRDWQWTGSRRRSCSSRRLHILTRTLHRHGRTCSWRTWRLPINLLHLHTSWETIWRTRLSKS